MNINLQFIRYIMKLRNIHLLLASLLLIFATCCTTLEAPTSGISKELATQRQATISDVEYDLDFHIPHSRNERVTGELTLRFHLKYLCAVTLDIRDVELHPDTLLANDTPAEYLLTAEHITLSPKSLREGENTLRLRFISSDQSLNRNEEYLYTLLVPDRARTLFPCFDQPDMKATYRLSLYIPEAWTAVSNTAPIEESLATKEGYKTITFAPTEPLSTYLFSFVAGKLYSKSYDDGTHRFTAYHRETDPKRIAQLDTIFKEIKYSLEWLEEYTAIDYPFAKYDLIMLPGFQYGGMEHTGATLYNASQMFLGDNPTLDELLRRSSVIAHETAHMWFGDYVTMRWFDDVWTKEVFANYFAARIVEPLYPSINHALSRLKSYTIASLSEDRTTGSNAIRQELDNLQNAGLIYGRIIYNKAPIVMDKIVEIMGDDAFRRGIRHYLRDYAYGNATWEDVIAILDQYTDTDLRSFSQVWVHSNAMPIIECRSEDNHLIISQQDPLHRGLLWPQRFTLRVLYADHTSEDIEVRLADATTTLTLGKSIAHITPNVCGRGYALFALSEQDIHYLLTTLSEIDDDLAREATLINLHELYKWGDVDAEAWLTTLVHALLAERNFLIASTLCDYLAEPLITHPNADIEAQLWHATTSHPITSLRRKLATTLAHCATSQPTIDSLYSLWQSNGATWLSDNETFTPLSDGDAMTLAYELAIRLPELQPEIIATQRARITNPDRLREFDYISRGTTPDTEELDSLFTLLLEPSERRTEPWAAALLKLLNHHTRQSYSLKYIYPGLQEVTEIQRTGDIFFPTNWTKALLGDHYTAEARAIVERFLHDNPDYSPLLRSKILQSADIIMTK